jgi:rod shape-determining protein MreD
MVLRALLLTGCLALGAALDGALFSRVPWGIVPDLLLLVVLAVSLRRGMEAGAVIGAAAGYLRDLVSGSPLGLFTLSYLLIGAAAGAASPMVNSQQRAIPAVAALAGTAALALVSAAIVAMTGVAHVDWPATAADTAAAAAINALLAGSIDAVVRGIDRLPQRRYAGRLIDRRVLR